MRGGDMELAAVRVFDGEDLVSPSVDDDLGRADVASDAVVDVDDVLAGLEVVEVGESRALSDRRFRAVVGLALGEDAIGFCNDEKGRRSRSRESYSGISNIPLYDYDFRLGLTGKFKSAA